MTKNEMIGKVRADIRAMGKYAVLNDAYHFSGEYILKIKCTKDSIMAIELWFKDGLLYKGGSLWDTTQKRIAAHIENFLSEVPND